MEHISFCQKSLMEDDKKRNWIYWGLILGGVFLVAGIFFELREKELVKINDIQWKIIRTGVCQVSFTVTNTSQTHLQMNATILVFIENKKEVEHRGSVIFYDEIGQRGIQIQLQPNQSQNVTYPVTILSLTPISIANVDVRIGKTSPL